MYIPSITTILASAFLIYMSHSIWVMSQLFTTLKCTSRPCYRSFLDSRPAMQLAVFSSPTLNPISSEVQKIYSVSNFNYTRAMDREFQIDIPVRTRRNGTLFLHVVLALDGQPLEWKSVHRDGPLVVYNLRLTEYMIPLAESFNLLGNKQNIDHPPRIEKEAGRTAKTLTTKPVTHIASHVHVALLTDSISLSQVDVPPEMGYLIRIGRDQKIIPILRSDFFNMRMKDLKVVDKNLAKYTMHFHYRPIGIGRLRLMLIIEHAMKTIETMGFSQKDVDEIKGILSETNVYILCGTFFIGTVHILLDFLSFKNDVNFWRKKRSYEGLSMRTTLWMAFSQVVVFFYLLDENTSLLVLVPAGLGALIDLWKCKKILKLSISVRGLRWGAANERPSRAIGSAEERTEQFDKEGMRYLTYLLYPLCIGGAVYSLIYHPHKGWYSWTLSSLVNGVYAFGFLFMLPQLFVNYKLKSVAALPWRAFMYKAFNTFIDDFFAFIITMPTAHRVACLRDDVVFLIYLYQRWLYPVDEKRLDTGLKVEDVSHRTYAATPAAIADKKVQ